MLKRHRFWVGFIILFLALTGESWGQTGPQEVKGSGPGGLYNPQSVITVAGTVVSITPSSAKPGLPYLVYLTLQTGEGKISIFLGPSHYVDKLPERIKVLDQIQVTGSKINWEGSALILAAEVKKGDKILKLRDPNGVPVWSSQSNK
jgi:hypothetical protein